MPVGQRPRWDPRQGGCGKHVARAEAPLRVFDRTQYGPAKTFWIFPFTIGTRSLEAEAVIRAHVSSLSSNRLRSPRMEHTPNWMENFLAHFDNTPSRIASTARFLTMPLGCAAGSMINRAKLDEGGDIGLGQLDLASKRLYPERRGPLFQSRLERYALRVANGLEMSQGAVIGFLTGPR